MTIEATHVKKKQLHHYLPPELVQRKKKSLGDINRSSNGGGSKRCSLDSSQLDSSRDTDIGTPFSSPTPISKPCQPASTPEDNSSSPPQHPVLVFMDSPPASELSQPKPEQGMSIPVIGSKPITTPVAKPPTPPAGNTIPTVVGRSVIPRLAASSPELANSVNGAPKRPHSPSLEDPPKRHKDTEVFSDDSAFKEPYPPSSNGLDGDEGQTVETLAETKAMPIPTIDTSRSQRLPSKELPDASSPIPTSNLRVIKNSIRLTLNR